MAAKKAKKSASRKAAKPARAPKPSKPSKLSKPSKPPKVTIVDADVLRARLRAASVRPLDEYDRKHASGVVLMQRTLDGDDDPVKVGAHPIFHDLERMEALAQTAHRCGSDDDIAVLYRLLTDAHERLAEAVDTSEADELREQLEAKDVEIDDAHKEANEFEKDNEKLTKEIETLKEKLTEETAALNEALSNANRLAALYENAPSKELLAVAEARCAELAEVEPLAMAFAVLCSVGLEHYTGVLDDEQFATIKAASVLLGAE